jgi:hypothetical protein
MRTSLLAGLLFVLVPACMVGEGGIVGVGDDDVGDDTGGGDGTGDGDGTGGGDGTGSGSGLDDVTPRLVAALDKTTLATENGKTETVTVNLTSENGWAGDVTLTKSLLDGANNPIANVTLDGPATVSVAADGTATASYSITIPTNTAGAALSASLKVSLSTADGVEDLTSAVTINNVYTVPYASGTGTTATNHLMAGQAITVKRGTIIKFTNGDNITHIIHGGGTYSGDHEDQTAGGAPGRTYEVPTIGYAPGSTGTLGCHSHGSASYATYTLQ